MSAPSTSRPPQGILFDTNFLLVPIRFGVDIFSESERTINTIVEFLVTPGVLQEIEYLKKTAKPSFRRDLEFAEKIASQCRVLDEEVNPSEKVDDSIVRIASKLGLIVGTTDAELRKKLRAEGVKVLVLRQRRYLELDG
ncbi:MAG: DNA-binding protein [Candidatus Bathyarchaeota archaeon]|nr:DNA-binding protein [Candidatus Bathyarchaeota archaeon]